MGTLDTLDKPPSTHELAIAKLLRKSASFPVLLGALLVVCSFVVTLAFRVDFDTWWHLVTGEQILKTHSVPTTDLYSFTSAGAGWIAYEWLGEVVIALAARLGGLTGLMGLLLVLAAAITVLVYYYSYLRCGNAKAAFGACLVVLPLAGVWFSLHPQLLGFVYFLVVLICLERFRQGRRRSLWLVPVVFWLWVNTHSSFVFGAAVFGVIWFSGLVKLSAGRLIVERWTAAERLQLALVCLFSLLGACVTPYGTQLAARPLELVFFGHETTGQMTSWQPIPLNEWHGRLFLALVVVLVVSLATSGTCLRLDELAVFLFAVYMTAQHSRALPIFAFTFAPVLASLLARWLPGYEPAKDIHLLNAVLIILAAVVIVKAFPSRVELQRVVAEGYPEQGVEYLRGHPPPRPMLNEIGFGGYMLYSLGPEYRLFIDGRVIDPAVFSDYMHMMQLDPDALRLLRKYDIRSCFIPPKSPLATFLASSSDWDRVYADRLSAVFVRRTLSGKLKPKMRP